MTGSVPFFTWLGRAPRALFAPARDSGLGTARLASARATAYSTLLEEAEAVYLAASRNNAAARRNFDTVHDLKFMPPVVGDLVWLFTPRLFRTTEDFAEFHTSKLQNQFGDTRAS